jgi:hypothetical protein
MKAKNLNRVPKKQWRRWSGTARNIFNDVYSFMMKNPTNMLHPKAEKPKDVHWKTTCWNAAWIAADAVDGCIPDSFVTV